MSFRSDAATATQSIIDALGEQVAVATIDAVPRGTVTAGFTDDYLQVDAAGMPVSSAQLAVEFKTSDVVALSIVVTDVVTIDGTAYDVVAMEPDTHGLTIARLRQR